ncbi:hypothetical protein ACIGBL_20935 [Streptomyces sp. NPDC085614]|uniref:hypothetical protein n=1 Tax=Streptomyces sp. NPDC085614 TaxID=3365733 RepID=UPI0037D69BEC
MNDPRVPYDSEETVRRSASDPADGPAEGPAPGSAAGPASGPASGPEAGVEEYSATVLGSHWFERPAEEVAPDRVEGEVLRFGPGVTAAALRRGGGTSTTAEMIWHGTLPGAGGAAPPPPRRRPRALSRYALAAVVLLAVLGYLGWQRLGPTVSVHRVTVTAPRETLGCDATADVVAVVATDGRPGTISYRWERSDGTTSGPLREVLTRGQREARLHLLWTFHGPGSHEATATLVITSPAGSTTTGNFRYRCD